MLLLISSKQGGKMKKVIILNGSPRKNFNTAQMLKEAEKGAQSTGAKTEYFDLYDYNFKGCVSCLACKRTGSKTNGLCAQKDDITPILEKCLGADAVIMGSPIYFSYPTGVFRCFVERFLYPCHSYMKDEKINFTKKVIDKTIPIGIIYTMNYNEEQAHQNSYPEILKIHEICFGHNFGYCETLYGYDTAQFDDYSKYDCNIFDTDEKIRTKETKFPKDLEKAFKLGQKLASMNV